MKMKKKMVWMEDMEGREGGIYRRGVSLPLRGSLGVKGGFETVLHSDRRKSEESAQSHGESYGFIGTFIVQLVKRFFMIRNRSSIITTVSI